MTRTGNYRRRILLGVLSTGAANVWSMFVVLVSLPLVLSGLGTEAFGTWVLLQTFSAVTGWFALADIGVGVATTRRVAEHLSAEDAPGATSVIDTALAIFLGLAVVAGLLLALGGIAWFPTWFHTPPDLVDDLRTATGLFAAQIALEIVTEGMESCLEGLQRIDLSRLADSARFTLVAIAVVIAAMTSGTLTAVAAASLAATAVGTVIATVVLVIHRPRGRPAPAGSHARSLLTYGPTVGVLNATGVGHRTMDRFVVGVILGPAAVTLIEIATQIQNGASAVLSATAYTATSAAPWLRARSALDQLRELLVRGTKYSMLLTMPFVVLALVLAGPLIDVWMGAKYADAVGLTRVAVLYIAMAAPLAVGSNALVGMGQARRVLGPAAIAALINLVT
ncbi:MAG: oligosaccharide flippase family protein, partial [Acidimicrobiia bacterium]